VEEMEKRLLLANHGKQLWTRERAREIRTELIKMLENLQPGDMGVIDCKGVEVFDYSFANELFGKTLLSLSKEYPDRFLVVENLTKYTRENLSKALESLGLIMIERKANKLDLLGRVHPADLETFKVIAGSREPMAAVVLKKKLGINLTAVNERLSKLTSLALIRRQMGVSGAGRQQYLYSVLA
jgi:hypothetical protein